MDIQLNALVGLVFAVLLLGTSPIQAEPSDRSLQARSGDCYSNCVSLVRTGQFAHVIAKDANGKVFKVVQLELPAEAEFVDSTVPTGGYHLMAADDGTTITQATDRFRTATHWVVVTYTFYGDANGNLIEVNVHEVRFPHTTMEN